MIRDLRTIIIVLRLVTILQMVKDLRTIIVLRFGEDFTDCKGFTDYRGLTG